MASSDSTLASVSHEEPMTALYIVLPLALLVAAGAVGAFIWTVRSGQLDDVDTPPRRILFPDDD